MGDARPFCACASAKWASELKRSLSSGCCWVERWCMAAPTAALNAALEPRPEALGCRRRCEWPWACLHPSRRFEHDDVRVLFAVQGLPSTLHDGAGSWRRSSAVRWRRPRRAGRRPRRVHQTGCICPGRLRPSATPSPMNRTRAPASYSLLRSERFRCSFDGALKVRLELGRISACGRQR